MRDFCAFISHHGLLIKLGCAILVLRGWKSLTLHLILLLQVEHNNVCYFRDDVADHIGTKTGKGKKILNPVLILLILLENPDS